MLTATTKNFHLPMPVSLYASLREAAARAGVPATGLARAAIEAWLKEDQRRQQRAELADFVEANAGTDWDLEPEWEAAGIEAMDKLSPWTAPPVAAGRQKTAKNPVVAPPNKPLAKAAAKRTPSPSKAVA